MAVRDLSHTAHIESLNLPQRHRWFRNHTLDLEKEVLLSPMCLTFPDILGNLTDNFRRTISLPVATSTAASSGYAINEVRSRPMQCVKSHTPNVCTIFFHSVPNSFSNKRSALFNSFHTLHPTFLSTNTSKRYCSGTVRNTTPENSFPIFFSCLLLPFFIWFKRPKAFPSHSAMYRCFS